MHTAGTHTARVAIAWDAPQSWPALQSLGEALLTACDAAVRPHAPTWLGHCKALFATGDQAAYASLTGADEPITWRGTLLPTASATVTLYAVVYGADDATVTAAVDNALRIVLPHATPLVFREAKVDEQ